MPDGMTFVAGRPFKLFGLGKDHVGLFRLPEPPMGAAGGFPPPRPWQEACHARVMKLAAMGRAHGYIQAPTGTGKTFMMAYHGENSDIAGVRVLVVGRDKLVKQHRKSLRRYGWTDTGTEGVMRSPRGDKWIILTWQAAAADATRMEKHREPSRYLAPGDEVGILFFDEAHIGGCLEEKDGYRSSITRIRDNWKPKFRIYVSATSNIVNEKLLGIRSDNSYVYSMAEAYRDGVLHPVSLVEVHCGTTALIQRVEAALGESFERLQYRGEAAEISAESHDELAMEMETREVALPNRASDDADERRRAEELRDQIIRARHEAMMALYFTKHAGEQAIFYCPNIKHADEALAHFRRIVADRDMTLRAEAVHTKSPDYEDKIALFEGTDDTRGPVDVLFVVGMLQEGFDMPRLRLAFDCRFYRKWAAPQVARLIQKLGRLTRIDEDPAPKRYYYARDITDYYGSRYIRPEVPDLVEREATAHRGVGAEQPNGEEAPDVTEMEPEDMLEATSEGISTLRSEIAEPGEGFEPPEVHHEAVEVDPLFKTETALANEVFGRSRRIHTVSSKLWELAKVSGGHVVNADSITRLISAEVDLHPSEREALDDLFGPIPSN